MHVSATWNHAAKRGRLPKWKKEMAKYRLNSAFTAIRCQGICGVFEAFAEGSLQISRRLTNMQAITGNLWFPDLRTLRWLEAP